jgi:hypothetical protein
MCRNPDVVFDSANEHSGDDSANEDSANDNADDNSDDSADDHTDSECESEENICIRAKWTIDDAKTIDEAIEKLHGFIEYLKSLKEEGYELRDPISDDYGFLYKSRELRSGPLVPIRQL